MTVTADKVTVSCKVLVKIDQREKARRALSQVKPFESWVAGMRPDQAEAVEMLGGARSFYDEFVGSLNQLARAP